MLNIGDNVTIKVKNILWPSRHLYASGVVTQEFNTYSGTIMREKWFGIDEVGITTGNPDFPFRRIDRQRIVAVNDLAVDFTQVPTNSTIILVQGSNGKTYEVDPKAGTCTCPGYTFRGQCRHVAEAQGKKVLDAVVQNVASKAKKDLTKSAKGATLLKLDVTKSIQDSSTNCRGNFMSNDNKLFTVVGTSTFKGQSKVRFTNDIAVRIKTLVKGGHTNVELIELPSPMTKAEAVAYLEANTPRGIDMSAVGNKGSDIGRKVKSSAIKTPVSKVAKAPVAESKAA